MHRLTGIAILMALSGCKKEVGDPGVLPDIEAWNAGLSPRDLELKYCKMVQSPFAFFRGTAHLFWADLGTDPRLEAFGTEPSWIQGDAHVLNVGAFDDDRGEVVYDLNDFDESVLADPQLDVWRFAASIVLAAEDVGGLPPEQVEDAVETFTEAWLDAIDELVDSDAETDSEFDEDNTVGALSEFLDDVEDEHTRQDLLERWTLEENGDRRFDLGLADLEPLTDDERDGLFGGMPAYAAGLGDEIRSIPDYFDVIDGVRRRDAGLGSLGTPRYYLRIEGPGPDATDDRLLDVKRQSRPSASEADERWEEPTPFDDHALRVATAQRALTNNADDSLGTLWAHDGPYTVRDLSPFKDAYPLDELRGRPKRLATLSRQWGTILAHAHARADDDHDPVRVPLSIEAEITDQVDRHHEEVRDLVEDIAEDWAEHMVDGHAAFVPWVEETYGFECE